MIITDNAYVFIALTYFFISITYLPSFVLPFIEDTTNNKNNNNTNNNGEGPMTRTYSIIRYFLGFVLYFIIGILYLILWNSHVGIIYKV